MTMRSESAAHSYDVSVFQVLTEEAPGDDENVVEKKVKRMLSRRRLGAYDQTRIKDLRSLRNELRGEISKFQNSTYYRGTPERSALEHFDFDRMVADFSKRYTLVKHPEIGGIVGYAIYYYYLR